MGEVKDVIDAKQITQRHLQKQRKVIFGHEIRSIFKRGLAWFVEIESKVFNLSRMTCHRGDGYTTSGISSGRNQPPLIFCEKCFLNEDAKQKVIEEIERLKRELVKLR